MAALSESRKAAQLKLGYILCIVGIGGFLPSILTAVFSDPWRRVAALCTLGFWVVWFLGKTLVKLARDPS